MGDLKDKILTRVRSAGRGRVHISKDFLDLGSRAAVDQALSRLVKEGTIRRVGRGLFDYPRTNARLKVTLSPDAEQVAQAVARKHGGKIRQSGAAAANSLGLSTQVPGRRVYLTDATGGTVRLGKQTLTFKRAAPRRLSPKDGLTATVLEALHYLGKDGITDEALGRLRGTLSERDKRDLLRQSRYAVGWVAEAVRRLVQAQE